MPICECCGREFDVSVEERDFYEYNPDNGIDLKDCWSYFGLGLCAQCAINKLDEKYHEEYDD